MSQEVNETINSNSIQTTAATTDTPTNPTTDPVKKSGPSRSLDAKLGRIAEMLAGIQTHTEPLLKRGIDTAFITEFAAGYQALLDAHNAQLAYKARMMEKTEEIQAKLSELQLNYSDARAQVKRILPKSTWREFGIVDQRR